MRVAIRNRGYAFGDLCKEAGYLEDVDGFPKFLLEYHTRSQFLFRSSKYRPIDSEEIICSECKLLVNDLRRRYISRHNFISKPIAAKTRHSYIASTPSAVMEFCDSTIKKQKRQYDQVSYLKRYNQRLKDHGVSIPIESAPQLFDSPGILDKGLQLAKNHERLLKNLS